MTQSYKPSQATRQQAIVYYLVLSCAAWLSWSVWQLHKDTDPVAGLIWISLIFAVEMFKVRAVEVLCQGFTLRVFAAAVVAFSFSVLNDITIFARSQSSHIAAVSGTAEADKRQEARRAELRRDLDDLENPRTVAELNPLIDEGHRLAERVQGECLRLARGKARETCESLPLLRSEAARASRAEELRERLGRVDAKGPATGASAEAKALAGLWSVMPWSSGPIEPFKVEMIALFCRLLAFQLLASMAGLVGPSSSAHPPRRPAPEKSTISTASSPPSPVHPPHTTHEELVISKMRLMPSLEVLGGRAKLAEQFGLSERKMRTALDNLAARGLVTVTTGPLGTSIRLTEEKEEGDENG